MHEAYTRWPIFDVRAPQPPRSCRSLAIRASGGSQLCPFTPVGDLSLGCFVRGECERGGVKRLSGTGARPRFPAIDFALVEAG